MIRSRRHAAALAALAVTAALAACGTTEETGQPGTDPPSAGPVTVTDSRGTTIDLPAPASRVVALEWGEIEMLVSLGVMPVGVADIAGYDTWVTAATLDASVTDVGTRAEPSVDSIAKLNPDLIVMESDNAPLIEQLEKNFTVLVTQGSDATDNLGRLRTDLTMIATAVGRTDQANALLADLDAAIADGKEKIAAAGAAGQYYAMADGWLEGSTVSIRMFGQGSLVSQLAIALGLKNAWTGETDAVWGLGQTDVEGLLAMKEANPHFFYNASDGTDVFADGLAGHPIWESLPFVQQKRVHRLPNGIWTFGGTASCKQYIDELVKVYTS